VTPTVLVGPEGGWSDEELAAVPVKVGLGPHVLRAETAAMAAGVLLSAMRAGLAAPAKARWPARGE
jgi:16S rRNA (uracil1498-N3)-methyltransferase